MQPSQGLNCGSEAADDPALRCPEGQAASQKIACTDLQERIHVMTGVHAYAEQGGSVGDKNKAPGVCLPLGANMTNHMKCCAYDPI